MWMIVSDTKVELEPCAVDVLLLFWKGGSSSSNKRGSGWLAFPAISQMASFAASYGSDCACKVGDSGGSKWVWLMSVGMVPLWMFMKRCCMPSIAVLLSIDGVEVDGSTKLMAQCSRQTSAGFLPTFWVPVYSLVRYLSADLIFCGTKDPIAPWETV